MKKTIHRPRKSQVRCHRALAARFGEEENHWSRAFARANSQPDDGSLSRGRVFWESCVGVCVK